LTAGNFKILFKNRRQQNQKLPKIDAGDVKSASESAKFVIFNFSYIFSKNLLGQTILKIKDWRSSEILGRIKPTVNSEPRSQAMNDKIQRALLHVDRQSCGMIMYCMAFKLKWGDVIQHAKENIIEQTIDSWRNLKSKFRANLGPEGVRDVKNDV